MDRDTDKGWAWMVLLAGYLQFVFSSGVYYTLSLYVVPLIVTYDQSRKYTSGIFALNAATHHFAGPVTAYLLSKLGSRGVVMLGGFLAATGSFTSVFANHIGVLYVTYGIINGIGTCITFCGWIVAISEYFKEKRNLALGVAMSGSGIGVLLFGPTLSQSMDYYGWRGTMLLSTGINLNLCLFGAVIYKKHDMNKVSRDKNKTYSENTRISVKDVVLKSYRATSVENQQIYEYEIYGTTQQSIVSNDKIATEQSNGYTKSKKDLNLVQISEKDTNSPKLNKKIMNPKRVIIQVSCVFSLMATTTLYMLLDDWIRSTEIEKLTIYAFIAIGLGDVVGRTITGVVSWKICNDRHILVLFALNHIVLFSALVLAAFSTTVMEIILASFLVGFVGGVQTVLTAVATMNNEDVEELGILLVASGLGSLMGPPLAAYLVELFNYKIALIVTSIEPLIASVMCCIGYFAEKYISSHSRSED